MTLVCVTATSDRPEAFALCQRMMARQTLQPDLWIVADDGAKHPVPESDAYVVVRSSPVKRPVNSFRQNMLAALRLVHRGVVAFVEDDDWYAPTHLRTLYVELEGKREAVAGDRNAVYYSLAARTWMAWRHEHHASLCQTACTADLVPWILRHIVGTKEIGLDFAIWKHARNPVLMDLPALTCVGMKGWPGKTNLGIGSDMAKRRADPDGAKLRELVGCDADLYAEFLK